MKHRPAPKAVVDAKFRDPSVQPNAAVYGSTKEAATLEVNLKPGVVEKIMDVLMIVLMVVHLAVAIYALW